MLVEAVCGTTKYKKTRKHKKRPHSGGLFLRRVG